mmetsp:Transcript_5491/g.15730  ORF Transcript_5491/g.15730 Transcript_5491/m.15730 type:complete len:420 (-) Transcript_5491:29-1288(-)
MVVGATLESGEHGEVDLGVQVVHDLLALLVGRPHTLAVEDHGAAGAAQGLVGGGGHHVRMVERRGHHTCGDETADVGHVSQQVGLGGVGDLAHARIVDRARVCAGTCNQHLGAVQGSGLLQRIVVDEASGLIQAVRHRLEEDRNGGDLLGVRLEAVAEVPTVGQVQSHDALVRLQQRREHLEVGRAAGQRLHIDAPLLWVQTERLQRTLLAEGLGLIDELVTAIVASAGVALAVFVGHHAAHRLHHAAAGEVLAGNQLQTLPLPVLLVLDDVEQLRVHLLQGGVERLGPCDMAAVRTGCKLGVLIVVGCQLRLSSERPGSSAGRRANRRGARRGQALQRAAQHQARHRISVAVPGLNHQTPSGPRAVTVAVYLNDSAKRHGGTASLTTRQSVQSWLSGAVRGNAEAQAAGATRSTWRSG